MKVLLYLSFAIISLFAACMTPEQLAQKHLKRAVKLDPTIIARQNVDTLIKDTARAIVAVETPAITVETPGVDMDSLLRVIDSLKTAGQKPEAYIYKDSAVQVSIKKDRHGKVSAAIDVKPQIIRVPVSVPYEKLVTVPGKTVKVTEPQPFYTYIWFWALLAWGALSTYLLFSRKR